MPMLEKQIEARVCDYAKSKGILVYKFVSPGHSGVPDRMLITPHKFVFFIEFKSAVGKLTAIQTREIERIRASGVKVWVINNVEAGIELIDSLMVFECAQ